MIRYVILLLALAIPCLAADCSTSVVTTQAGTPGPPQYGGLRNDCVISNINTIPNVWTSYTADYGLLGAGKQAINNMGNSFVRVTDGNTDSAHLNFAYTTNYSGSDEDQHISIDGSMFGIGRQAGQTTYMYCFTTVAAPLVCNSGQPDSTMTVTPIKEGGVIFQLPAKTVMASMVTPKVFYILGGTNGTAIIKYDLTNCTPSNCHMGTGSGTFPAPSTVYDFAAGSCLNGLVPTAQTVFRVSDDDSLFHIGFSYLGGQDTATLVATFKQGQGCRVWNTCAQAGNGSPLPNGTCRRGTTFPGDTPDGNTAGIPRALTCTAPGCDPVNHYIPASNVVGDYGPTGIVCMGLALFNTTTSDCTNHPVRSTGGAGTGPDGFKIHEVYTSRTGTWAQVTGLACTAQDGTGVCASDAPWNWLISGLNVIATSQGGHFCIGTNYINRGTNTPQVQMALSQIISGGALVPSVNVLNLISTASGTNNLPAASGPFAPKASFSLDEHCSWNNNIGATTDTAPILAGNTTSWVADFGSPPVPNGVNDGCVIPQPLWAATSTMPSCGTANPFFGPFVNEELLEATAPLTVGATPCTVAPCAGAQTILRPGNTYITGISWNFSGANNIQSISPTGTYALYTSDHMCTLGLKNGASLPGVCGGINWQKANNYLASDEISPQSSNNTLFCTYKAPSTCGVAGKVCTSAPTYTTGAANPAYPDQPVWVTGGVCNNNVPDGTPPTDFQWQLVGVQNMRVDVFLLWLTAGGAPPPPPATVAPVVFTKDIEQQYTKPGGLR